ncbi:hypothetical protein CIB48_g274 [Xylaria polymorpha]|nr:hypothetical protein CIB48_g274 [Xylaria polymorpha]
MPSRGAAVSLSSRVGTVVSNAYGREERSLARVSRKRKHENNTRASWEGSDGGSAKADKTRALIGGNACLAFPRNAETRVDGRVDKGRQASTREMRGDEGVILPIAVWQMSLSQRAGRRVQLLVVAE